MRLKRYIRVLGIFVRASISAQLEYRVNFAVNLFGSLLLAGGTLLGITILYSDGTPLGGWSYRESIVVVGLFTLVQGYIGAFLYPNLNKIGEEVRQGTMDFNLLKPVDAQFLISSRNINVFRLTDALVGAGLVIWAASGLENASSIGALLGLCLIVTALTIVYAVWFMLSMTAFWFVKVGNVTELFNGFFRAGAFPVSALPGWVRLVFTFLIPVAFVTTVPAEAIIGRWNAGSVLGSGVAAVLLLGVSRWFWTYAISKYTSASS